MTTHVGVDLAWGVRARTGLAAVDDHGRLLASASVRTDDELDAWLADHCADIGVVAIDAPLIVTNPTGQRVCERLVTSAYGRYDAGCHASNTGFAYMNPPRATTLAQRWGWETDPASTAWTTGSGQCLEVYPHAAMVGLFGLGRTLKYKKGRVVTRQPAMVEVLRLLETIASLGLAESERWGEIRQAVTGATRPMHLDAVEDEVDAILCGHLAWLWAHDRGQLQVYGDHVAGYIVAPPPPTHAATKRTHQQAVPAPDPARRGIHAGMP